MDDFVGHPAESEFVIITVPGKALPLREHIVERLTQAMTYFWNSPEEINLIWPIEDPQGVNQRRKAAGFTQTVEEYAREILDGEAYRVYTMEEIKEFQERQKQATQ